jgi:hypothetical protein
MGEVPDAIRAKYGPLMATVRDHLLDQCEELLAQGAMLRELVGIVVRDEREIMAIVTPRSELTPEVLAENKALRFAIKKEPMPGFLVVAAFYEDEESVSQTVFSFGVSAMMTKGGSA